ncbi:MAG: sulfur carrier protein ThiS [bacterium]|nr:sulfur carrier protein ThiS [bacterium]
MQITLNGEEHTFTNGLSVHDLLAATGLDPSQKGIAVACNAEIVPRTQWVSTRLKTGDRIDIINAVQGG